MPFDSADRAAMPESADNSVLDLDAVTADTDTRTDTDTGDEPGTHAGPDTDTDVAPGVTFADLGLPEAIVRKLSQNGVVTPFPIQAATIPDALAGQDILGRGRTG